MSSPRILVMTTVPETLAGFFVRQLRSLDAAGFAVHVASSPGPVLEALDLGPGVRRYGVAMERQPHPVRDLVSLGRLCALMLRLRPDIVHCHTPKAGLLGLAAATITRVPIRLYTVHGLPLLTRRGWRRRMLEAAERVSARLATRTYSVSHSVQQALAELSLCSSALVLGHGSCAGVDTQRFAPAPEMRAVSRQRWNLPDDATVVTFVGRLARDKGVGVLAQAWPQVARRVPQAVLVLAGEADHTDPIPEADLSALRKEPSVRWTGGISAADVPALYAGTDVAVLPTFREGLSQISLEAGAMGLPLVSCKVTGLDAVVPGVTGTLVPAADAGALAEALIALACDPAARVRMGQAARLHVAGRYAATQVNQLWMSEYLRLARAGAAAESVTAGVSLS